jgi:hypothetical protein
MRVGGGEGGTVWVAGLGSFKVSHLIRLSVGGFWSGTSARKECSPVLEGSRECAGCLTSATVKTEYCFCSVGFRSLRLPFQ